MEDWIKSIQVQLHERVTSPLMAAFAISWSIWNYRFLIILFSDTSVSETFRLIDGTHFHSITSVITRGIVFPLASAILFIYVYPIPAKHVYQYWRSRQRQLVEIRRDIEGQTPLTIEESQKIRDEMYRQANLHRSEVESREREIQNLREQISSLTKPKKKEQKEYTEKTTPPSKQITMGQHQILQHLADQGGFAYSSQLTANDPSVRLQRDFDIGELHRLGLINGDTDEEGVPGYSLSHEGRGCLLRAMEENE